MPLIIFKKPIKHIIILKNIQSQQIHILQKCKKKSKRCKNKLMKFKTVKKN